MMKKVKEFRNFSIQRSCEKKYASHSSYKVFLREDFHQRCAYCNLKDDQILRLIILFQVKSVRNITG